MTTRFYVGLQFDSDVVNLQEVRDFLWDAMTNEFWGDRLAMTVDEEHID